MASTRYSFCINALGSSTQYMGVTTRNWLGRSQFEADAYFEGELGEFRIYDRVLSPGEIRYLAGER